MYRTLVGEQGRPCHDVREPHSTRFKDHLLNLLPEWSEYSQGKDIFISNKSKVADLLAKAHDSQIDQGDALLLMRAAVILRKCCLHKQEPFSGTFSPDCLISPVPQELRSFVNIILQGPSILREQRNVEADEPEHGRDNVACTISQLLIYNTYGDTHHGHATQTNTIRHGKDHETPILLYQGLNMHGDARLKKQIENAHELGMSVSYDRVMDVKRAIARAVCKCHADDGVITVVLPTNLRSNVFTTYDVDNLDSHNKGHYSQDDAIWDNYPEDNLKSLMHQRRGTGPRTRIGDGHTQITKHEWNSGFLKNEENKKELFPFLGEEIVKKDLGGKLLLSTKCERVRSNRPCDVPALEPCNHSEADTRKCLHLAQASGQGHQTAYVRTVDSDIVVLAIRFFPTRGLVELWVGFGSGKTLRDIPIHDICSDLGPSRFLCNCHFSMPSKGATLHHTSLDVARRRLGYLGKIHQYSLKHCWH